MTKNSWQIKEFYHGLIAGSIQVLAVYPLDVLRVKYFLKGSIDRLLYNGLIFSLLTNILKQGMFYPSQNIFSKTVFKDHQLIGNILTGTGLGIVATPINAIKVPLQLNGDKKWHQVCSEIYNRFGIKGFFNGVAPTICRDTVWATTYFSLFKIMKEQDHGNLTSVLFSSIIANSVAYPFDGARLYRQNHHERKTIIAGFRNSFTLKSNNVKSFLLGNFRATVATCIGHNIYLFLGKAE